MTVIRLVIFTVSALLQRVARDARTAVFLSQTTSRIVSMSGRVEVTEGGARDLAGSEADGSLCSSAAGGWPDRTRPRQGNSGRVWGFPLARIGDSSLITLSYPGNI